MAFGKKTLRVYPPKQERTLFKAASRKPSVRKRQPFMLAKFRHNVELLSPKSRFRFFTETPENIATVESSVSYAAIKTGIGKTKQLSANFAPGPASRLWGSKAAWGYAHGTITRERLLEMIPGEDLSTGELPANP